MNEEANNAFTVTRFCPYCGLMIDHIKGMCRQGALAESWHHRPMKYTSVGTVMSKDYHLRTPDKMGF